MAWIVVPNLLELREQLNTIAPKRDKASDGTVGDYNHSKGRSSHNPDDIKGNAEWESDPDGKEEIRAIDFDIDFKVPGLTARKFVDHLLKYARNGTFWWLRYIIYDRTIWSKSNGWASRSYSGSNPHDKHVHVNSDFSQAADDVKNVNYRLNELLPEVDMPLTREDAQLIIREFRNTREVLSDTNVYIIAGETAKRIAPALQRIEAALGLEASEVPPTAQENAEAVVAALGGVDTETLAETLRNVLGAEKVAALKEAL